MATMLARSHDPARTSPMRPAGALPDCKERAIAGKAQVLYAFSGLARGDGPIRWRWILAVVSASNRAYFLVSDGR
jgi:hypothetical protein